MTLSEKQIKEIKVIWGLMIGPKSTQKEQEAALISILEKYRKDIL